MVDRWIFQSRHLHLAYWIFKRSTNARRTSRCYLGGKFVRSPFKMVTLLMILELILFIISMCSSVYADGLNDAITMAPIKSVEDSRLTTSIDRIPVSRVDSRFGNLFIRSSGFSLPMMIDPPCPRLASSRPSSSHRCERPIRG